MVLSTHGKWISWASPVKCLISFDWSVFVMKPSGVPREWGTAVMLNVVSSSVLCKFLCHHKKHECQISVFLVAQELYPGQPAKNIWYNHNILSVVPWWIYPYRSVQLLQPQNILHNILCNSSPRWQHKQMRLVMHDKRIQVFIECIQGV